MKKISILLTVGFLLIISTSCNRDKNHPGYTFVPDMADSRAYETYTENPVFENGKTMRTPADGTIPRGFTPYPFKAKSFEDQQKAGLELTNPIALDEQSLATGKEQYDIYCKVCHGAEGKGDGHLYTSKLFGAKPTSLVEDYVKNKPDGEIYHVITLGSLSGLMGPHGGQILPENRWKIIHYMRSLAK
jgi:mono/diheme cytochrome c family protein